MKYFCLLLLFLLLLIPSGKSERTIHTAFTLTPVAELFEKPFDGLRDRNILNFSKAQSTNYCRPSSSNTQNAIFSNPQTANPSKLSFGHFLTSWLLLGPIPLQVQTDPEKSFEHLPGFNTDYLTKLGGERNLSVKEGDIVKLAKGTVTWKYLQSTDSIINLAKTVSKAFPVFAYAYTEVEAAEDGIKMIGLGTNDGQNRHRSKKHLFNDQFGRWQ